MFVITFSDVCKAFEAHAKTDSMSVISRRLLKLITDQEGVVNDKGEKYRIQNKEHIELFRGELDVFPKIRKAAKEYNIKAKVDFDFEDACYDLVEEDDFDAVQAELTALVNADTNLSASINMLTRLENPSLFERNFQFHKYLIDGVTVESKDYEVNPLVRFIDFNNPQKNTFQVSHQIKFNEGRSNRIPDVIVFINGLPLVVMELKSFDELATDATLEHAYAQLGSNSEHDGYRFDIPTLFNYNAFLVIYDGVSTKVGTLTAKIDRYNEWKSVDGEKGYDDNCVTKLNILIDGLFDKNRIIDVIKNNLFYIQDKNDKPVKIMAQYHQFFGVKKALASISKTVKPVGNGKAGIVWRTQGSGKSFSMVMLAHRLLLEPSLNVPTIVVLTDRIDLDEPIIQDVLQCS